MPGLISALTNSTKALSVHSKGLEIAGKNLANINNRNYAKQRVEIGDRGSINTGIATESMGVEAMELRQNRDVLLDKGVMRELSSTAALTAAKKILQSAETALGQFLDRTTDSSSIQSAPGATGGGISDALGEFFNAWESFSVKPNDVGVKQLLLQKAEILAEKINVTDQRLANVQTDVDNQVATDIGVVNDILKNIAEINGQIAKAENGRPYAAVDLRDQRQAKLEELSVYMDVNFQNIPDSNGQIAVTTTGADGTAVFLVDGNEVPGESAIAYDPANGEFTFGGIQLGFSTGSLQAMVAARNDDVQDARDQVEDLASQLRTSVNEIYSTTGSDFFLDGDGLPIDLVGTLTPTTLTATATANQGANDVALAVADLANRKFTKDPAGINPGEIEGTFIAHYNTTVSQLGQTLNTTNVRLEDQALSEEMARVNRDQFSGVSQDEEITDLLKFQRSFQASARHINIVDTLLDQVVNRLGVG